MRQQAYIFDYGGTLDACGNHWGKVIWHAYERVGIPVSEQQYRDAYVYAERTLGSQHIIMSHFTFRDTLSAKLTLQLDYLFEQSILVVSDDQHDDYHRQLLDILYSDVVTTIAHSREVLSRIAMHSKMVLVSNFYGNIQTVLREFSLDEQFFAVVESAVVGIRKPDPRIFALGVDAIKRCLNTDDVECIVVGDSMDKDIVPAKSIGCTTVWYQGEPWKDAPLDTTSADIVIHDLSELLTVATRMWDRER